MKTPLSGVLTVEGEERESPVIVSDKWYCGVMRVAGLTESRKDRIGAILFIVWWAFTCGLCAEFLDGILTYT